MNKAEEKPTANQDSFADDQAGDSGAIAILLVVLVMFLAILGFAAYMVKNKG